MVDSDETTKRLMNQLQALTADNNVECELCFGGEGMYPCPKCNPAEAAAQRARELNSG